MKDILSSPFLSQSTNASYILDTEEDVPLVSHEILGLTFEERVRIKEHK